MAIRLLRNLRGSLKNPHSIDTKSYFARIFRHNPRISRKILELLTLQNSSLREFVLANSWQSKQNKFARSANPCKSFCFVLLVQKVESLYCSVIARFGNAESKQSKKYGKYKMISAEVFLMRNRGCEATSEEIRLGVY